MANIEISGQARRRYSPLREWPLERIVRRRDRGERSSRAPWPDDDAIIGKFRVQLRNAQGKLVKTLHWTHPQIRHSVFNTATGPGSWTDGLLLSDGPNGIVLLFAKPFPEVGAVIPTDLDRLRTGLETSLVYLGHGSRQLSVTEGLARRVGD